MGLKKRFRNFRVWCPQPRDRTHSKFKRYSFPVAVVLLGILVLPTSLLIFSTDFPHPAPPLISVTTGLEATSSAPALSWNRTYDGFYSVSMPSYIIQTADGGYLLAGTTGHKYILGEAWLVKTDAAGNLQWNETIATTQENLTCLLGSVAGIVQTSDGGYVVGGNEAWFDNEQMNAFSLPVSSSIILFKLDSLGNVQWNQTYSDAKGSPVNDDGTATCLIQTSGGGYAIAGNGFLLKTASSGKLQWVKTYTNASFTCVVQTNDGGYALIGNNNQLFKMSSSGAIEWHKTFPLGVYPSSSQTGAFTDLSKTGDGGLILLGNEYLGNSENTVPALFKVDSHGSIKWNQTLAQGFSPNNVVQTSDGGFALFGTWSGNIYVGNGDIRACIEKTNAQGVTQWNFTQGFLMTIGNSSFDIAWPRGDLGIETSDGGFALAGGYDNSGDFVSVSFSLLKTEPALAPPSPTSTQTTSTQSKPAMSQTKLTLIAIVGVAIVASLITIVVLKNKQRRIAGNTLPANVNSTFRGAHE